MNALHLLPEQVIPFLQHDQWYVREHAGRYFRESHQLGPLTADHYWAVIDRLGETDEALGFAADLGDLPQTDQSVRRLLATLGSGARDHFEFHYQRAARDMEMAALIAHREEVLSCPQLLAHVREHLQFRLKLLDEPPAQAWEQLMAHGRSLAGANSLSFNASTSDVLVEAAARGGEEVCRQAMLTLADESAAEDWREILAVRVLGQARYEPAIDDLVNKMAIDADVLREETSRALARIGTLEVLDRIVSFYPGKPWHVRLYTHGPIAKIKGPESVAALLALLEVELALAADPESPEDEGGPLTDSLLSDLTELGSLVGLDVSRPLIEAAPNDPELVGLQESLLATATMHGVTLPEADRWLRRVERHHERAVKAGASFDEFAELIRGNWRKSGVSFPQTQDVDAEKGTGTGVRLGRLAAPDPDRLEPIRNSHPKVGRNEPCPCGSGKKYKKCCGA